MYLFYFNSNNNEIAVYVMLIASFFIALFATLAVDRYNQKQKFKLLGSDLDFYSFIGTEYTFNYNKLDEDVIISKIRTSMQYFNVIQFKSFVSDVYLTHMETFEKKTATIVQQYATKESYLNFKNIIDNNTLNNYTTTFKNFKYNLIVIEDYSSTDENEVIWVSVYYSTILYTLDKNNHLLFGHPTKNYDFKSTIKFILNSNVKNNENTYIIPKTLCPKCDNVLNISEDGLCTKCDLDIQNGNSHWVIDSLAFNIHLPLDDK
ncbi:MAG: hypothetical protein ACK5LY_07130 [Lachnospirales bacterium]